MPSPFMDKRGFFYKEGHGRGGVCRWLVVGMYDNKAGSQGFHELSLLIARGPHTIACFFYVSTDGVDVH